MSRRKQQYTKPKMVDMTADDVEDSLLLNKTTDIANESDGNLEATASDDKSMKTHCIENKENSTIKLNDKLVEAANCDENKNDESESNVLQVNENLSNKNLNNRNSDTDSLGDAYDEEIAENINDYMNEMDNVDKLNNNNNNKRKLDDIDDHDPASFDDEDMFDEDEIDELKQFDDGSMRTETANGELMPFQCKICLKSFKHNRSLSRHIVLHSGEKKYQCQFCSSTFARSDHLKSHMKSHDNSKPYKCEVCSCGFASLAALKVHQSHQHTRSKFRCSKCNDLEFHSQLSLEGHIYTVHMNGGTLDSKKDSPTRDSSLSASFRNDPKRFKESPNKSEFSSNDPTSSDNQTTSNDDDVIVECMDLSDNRTDPTIQRSINQSSMNANVPRNAGYNLRHSNQHLPAPRNLPITNQPPNATFMPNRPALAPQPSPSQTAGILPNNTYCELCNARFSNSDSYLAHMRNCHPNIYIQHTASIQKQQQQQSILSTQPLAPSASQQPMNLRQPLPPPPPPQVAQMPSKMTIMPGAVNKTGSNGSIITPTIPQPATNQSMIPGPVNNHPNLTNQLQKPSNFRLQNGANDSTSNDLNDSPYIIKESQFTCVQCSATFYKPSDYIDHVKRDHCVEVYRCMLCKQMQLFDNLNLLKDHFLEFHQAKKFDFFRCRLCQGAPTNMGRQIYQTPEDLNRHLVEYHQVHSAFTSMSADKFARPQMSAPPVSVPVPLPPPPSAQPPPTNHSLPGLRAIDSMHQPSGYQSNRFPSENLDSNRCSKCNAEFGSLDSLNHHMMVIHNIRINNGPVNNNAQFNSNITGIFPCKFCRSTFNNRTQLERHLRIHVSSIDLKCNICDKKFENSDQLNQHKLEHSRSLNLSNSLLPPMSKQPSNLICSFCNESIQNEIQFKEHFKKHNNIGVHNPNGPKPNIFPCIICREQLSSSVEYNSHIRIHFRPTVNQSSDKQNNVVEEKIDKFIYENKYRCDKCLVKFEEIDELVSHMSLSHSLNLRIIMNRNGSSSNTPPINRPSLNEPNQLRCEICLVRIESNLKLEAHLLSEHEFFQNKHVFTCPVCDEQFSRPEGLLNHAVSHGQAAKIYKCAHCPESFVFKTQLINHSFVHQKPSNNANSTNEMARTNGNYNNNRNFSFNGVESQRHLQLNRTNNYTERSYPREDVIRITNQYNQEVFRCSVCSLEFDSINAYSIHYDRNHVLSKMSDSLMPASTESGANICPFCSKAFSCRRNLKFHIRIHTGFRPFECSICFKKFTRKDNMRNHMKYHLNIRPFVCQFCSKGYTRRTHLTCHVETHMKTRSHTCIVCSAECTSTTMLVKHLLHNHNMTDREICDAFRSDALKRNNGELKAEDEKDLEILGSIVTIIGQLGSCTNEESGMNFDQAAVDEEESSDSNNELKNDEDFNDEDDDYLDYGNYNLDENEKLDQENNNLINDDMELNNNNNIIDDDQESFFDDCDPVELNESNQIGKSMTVV